MTDVAMRSGAGMPSPVAARERRARGRTRRPAHRAHGRLPAMLLALALVVVVLASGGVPGGGGGAPAQAESAAAASEPAEVATRVVVESGETAWEALKAHRPAGMDHAVFVHEVMSFNGVDARELRPGDALRVPAAPAG